MSISKEQWDEVVFNAELILDYPSDLEQEDISEEIDGVDELLARYDSGERSEQLYGDLFNLL